MASSITTKVRFDTPTGPEVTDERAAENQDPGKIIPEIKDATLCELDKKNLILANETIQDIRRENWRIRLATSIFYPGNGGVPDGPRIGNYLTPRETSDWRLLREGDQERIQTVRRLGESVKQLERRIDQECEGFYPFEKLESPLTQDSRRNAVDTILDGHDVAKERIGRWVSMTHERPASSNHTLYGRYEAELKKDIDPDSNEMVGYQVTLRDRITNTREQFKFDTTLSLTSARLYDLPAAPGFRPQTIEDKSITSIPWPNGKVARATEDYNWPTGEGLMPGIVPPVERADWALQLLQNTIPARTRFDKKT